MEARWWSGKPQVSGENQVSVSAGISGVWSEMVKHSTMFAALTERAMLTSSASEFGVTPKVVEKIAHSGSGQSSPPCSRCGGDRK